MTLPSSGPLSLANIQGEFGGSNPIGLAEYYAGGPYVPAGTSGTYGSVPSSGTISIQNFYGTSAYTSMSPNIGSDQGTNGSLSSHGFFLSCAPSGGVGPYTYSWAAVSSPSYPNTGGFTSTTAQSTYYTINLANPFTYDSASVQCTVTDSTLQVVASNIVSLTYSSP